MSALAVISCTFASTIGFYIVWRKYISYFDKDIMKSNTNNEIWTNSSQSMYPHNEGRCHSRPGGFGRRLLPTLRKRCFLSLSFMEIAVLFLIYRLCTSQYYRNLRTPLSLRGLLPPRLLAFLGIVLLLLLLGSDLVIEVLLLLLDAR